MPRSFEERLRDLQRDCGDGHDLTVAMSLIGDAVERRVSRMRRSMRDIQDDTPADATADVDRVVHQLRALIDGYETSLQQHHDRWQRSMDDFEERLAARADELPTSAE